MDQTDLLEFWAERAAIMQFDAGIARPDADFYAAILTRKLADRHGIEIRHHWLRSITRMAGAEWSDDKGKVVVKREEYFPPQFRG